MRKESGDMERGRETWHMKGRGQEERNGGERMARGGERREWKQERGRTKREERRLGLERDGRRDRTRGRRGNKEQEAE